MRNAVPLPSGVSAKSRWRLAPQIGFALVVAVALVAAPGGDARATQPSAGTVLLIGDSNIFGSFGRNVELDLRRDGYRVIRRGKPTSGLARPDFFDWFVEARRLIDLHQPDAIVMLFGGNDGQRLRFGDRELGSIRWEDETRWRTVYESRIRGLMEVLSGESRRVVLLSPTNRRSSVDRARMSRVREVMAQATAPLERVTYVDMFPLTSDERGQWLRVMRDERGRPVSMRRDDGIHLTPEGGAEVARRVRPVLARAGL